MIDNPSPYLWRSFSTIRLPIAMALIGLIAGFLAWKKHKYWIHLSIIPPLLYLIAQVSHLGVFSLIIYPVENFTIEKTTNTLVGFYLTYVHVTLMLVTFWLLVNQIKRLRTRPIA